MTLWDNIHIHTIYISIQCVNIHIPSSSYAGVFMLSDSKVQIGHMRNPLCNNYCDNGNAHSMSAVYKILVSNRRSLCVD